MSLGKWIKDNTLEFFVILIGFIVVFTTIDYHGRIMDLEDETEILRYKRIVEAESYNHHIHFYNGNLKKR